MVRAILEGRKTQTRRVVKPQDAVEFNDVGAFMWLHDERKPHPCEYACSRGGLELCPYGAPGDRLWVRETWACLDPSRRTVVLYKADESPLREYVWRPSIHMPRWASRLTLEVTGVRVERLQDISEEDAKAEGCSGFDPSPEAESGTAFVWKGRSSKPDPRAHFAWLWESFNGPESWAANPWVWVVEFRRVEAKEQAA